MTDAAPVAQFAGMFTVLRRRFIYSVGAVLAGAIVGWIFSGDLLRIMQLPFAKVMGEGRYLVFTAPHEGFVAHLTIGLVAGVIIASPYLFLQIWWLFAPVFYRKQRRMFMLLAMLSAITFVLGALFGYFGILPAAIDFLVKGFEQRAPFEAFLKVRSFLGFAIKLLLVFGLAFELPMLMFILGRLGLVSARSLWKGFRYAMVIILIGAALFTPPDVLTQVMLAGPLCLLYLVGVGAVALFGKRKTQA